MNSEERSSTCSDLLGMGARQQAGHAGAKAEQAEKGKRNGDFSCKIYNKVSAYVEPIFHLVAMKFILLTDDHGPDDIEAVSVVADKGGGAELERELHFGQVAHLPGQPLRLLRRVAGRLARQLCVLPVTVTCTL